MTLKSYIVPAKQPSSLNVIKVSEENLADEASKKFNKKLEKISEEASFKENLSLNSLEHINLKNYDSDDYIIYDKKNIQPNLIQVSQKDTEKEAKITTIFHNSKNYLNNYRVS